MNPSSSLLARCSLTNARQLVVRPPLVVAGRRARRDFEVDDVSPHNPSPPVAAEDAAQIERGAFDCIEIVELAVVVGMRAMPHDRLLLLSVQLITSADR